jgi:hypothetical protein
MTRQISLADRLSGLNARLRFAQGSGRRSRRGKPSSKFAAQVLPFEGRCLMASGILIPANTVASASAVMHYDSSANEKTILITNNSTHTVYPFLEDSNSRSDPGEYVGTGTFDPFDPINQEYRGYVGYSSGGQNYLGLLPGQSITVNVPIAFWDAGRLIITTDGTTSPGGSDLLGPNPTTPLADQAKQSNAFLFHYSNQSQTAVATGTVTSPTLDFTPIYNQTITGPDGKPTTEGAKLPTGVVPGVLVTGPGILEADRIIGTGATSVTLKNPILPDPNGLPLENTTYTFTLPSSSNIGGDSNLHDHNLNENQVFINHDSADNQGLLYYMQYEIEHDSKHTFTITSSTAPNGSDIPDGTTVTAVDPTTGVITLSNNTIESARGGHQYAFSNVTLGPTSIFTVPSVAAKGSITNGLIMWYHASQAQAPSGGAPAQLTEMTFRSTYYAPANNKGFYYLFGENKDFLNANDFNLINYDISYVDSMIIPVAMEAFDVPTNPDKPQPPGKNPTYGWVGSSQTILSSPKSPNDLQPEIQDFASTGAANGLGTYFPNDKGWPSYYDPGAELNGTKLPSGQNLFLESPYNDTRSIYNNNVFALTSAGTDPIKESIGAAGNAPTEGDKDYLMLSTDPIDIPKLKALYDALNPPKGTPPAQFTVSHSPESIADKTMLMSVEEVKGVPTGKVFLNKNTIGSQAGQVYDFDRVITDYAANAIMSLWYSWANYYAMSQKVPPSVTGSGTVDPEQTNQIINLKLDTEATLVPGMSVTENGTPIGVVLKVSGTTVTLSQIVTGAGPYTFNAPSLTALAGYNDSKLDDPIWSLIPNFKPSGTLPKEAEQFASNVYVVMATMSSTVATKGIRPKYDSVSLLANIIGATVSKLESFAKDPTSPGGKDILATVTNDIKSALRGVPDFTTAPYDDPTMWYPDPSVPIPGSGQTFNDYNLDPFVWFVHEKLGLSGYGFSVDDDTADVGANGSTHLEMSVGGLGGLTNSLPWTSVAPYGPQLSPGTLEAGGKAISGVSADILGKAIPYNEPQKLLGALVNGPGIAPGSTVQKLSVEAGGLLVTLRPPSKGTKKTNSGQGSEAEFYFFGPVVGTGQVEPNGTTIAGLNPAALATLKAIAPTASLQANLLISGPGIQKGTTVTIDFTSGNVSLSKPLARGLKAGSYGYTFK